MESSYPHGSDPSKQPHPGGQHNHKSSSELLSSAKLVAEAAKSSMGGNKSDEVDKARVAGAAADLLDAASHYGKLEDKSYGKYLEKAEEYLNQYGSSHSSGHSSTPAAAVGGGHGGQSGPEGAHKPSESSGGHEGGGYGDYLKMAQGFLKK